MAMSWINQHKAQLARGFRTIVRERGVHLTKNQKDKSGQVTQPHNSHPVFAMGWVWVANFE